MRKAYPLQSQSLKNVVTVQDFIQHEYFHESSPFIPASRFKNFLRKTLVIFFSVVSKCVGSKLFIENKNQELFVFDKSTRNLLTKLLSEKVLLGWECGASNVETDQSFVCQVTADAVAGVCPPDVLNGSGASPDISTALNIACAETIERRSATEWNEDSLLRMNLKEIAMSKKNFFYHKYFGEITENQEEVQLGWVLGRDFFSREAIYMPASMHYLFYAWQYPQENIFLDISSNGVAAYTGENKALVKAIYELLERDGFLMYWLNKLSPQQIDTSSIKDVWIQKAISTLKKRAISVYLLDCKTEFNVPVVVAVLVDDLNKAVHVDAASSYFVQEAITKILQDALKWNPDAQRDVPPSVPYEKITSISERKNIWYSDPVRYEIDFFISGKKISFEEYKAQFPDSVEISDELTCLSQVLKKHAAHFFYFNYKNKIATDVGLEVVKVTIPELLPMYFVESMKPIHAPRLYTFCEKMNFSNKRQTLENLNTVPHPFI